MNISKRPRPSESSDESDDAGSGSWTVAYSRSGEDDKRKRVTIACLQCRERKVRCDGTQPSCNRCLSRGSICGYPKKPTRKRVSAKYVRQLEEKLEQLSNQGRNSESRKDISGKSLSSIRDQDDGIPAMPSDHVNSSVDNSVDNCSGDLDNSMKPCKNSHPRLAPLTNSLSKHVDLPSNTLPEIAGESPSNMNATEEADNNSAPDGMGAGSTKTLNRRQDFYGSSSAVSFMRLVEAKISSGKKGTRRVSTALEPGYASKNDANGSAQNGDANSRKKSSSPRYKFSYLSSDAHGPTFAHNGDGESLDSNVWSIPPRRLADYYVQLYFTYIYTLYPFIHRPSFMEAYESIWKSSSSASSETPSDAAGNDEMSMPSYSTTLVSDISHLSPISSRQQESEISCDDATESHLFFCILNIVFSFGCLFTSGLGTPSSESSSDIYYKRAKEHLNFNDRGDSSSLIVLQILLLSGQYLQATDKPAACWNVVGLAVRVAQELGLHRESQIASRSSMIEQEMCRRLWYGCILMDRTVSMTFGRPLMIFSDFKVLPPAFIDDKYITDSGIVPTTADAPPSVLCFFEQTLRLYEILADVLRFYETQDTNSMSDDDLRLMILSNILELGGKLKKFKKSIPPYLRIDLINQHSSTSQFRRLTNVLQIRYWHMEIMLYRPILMPHRQVGDDCLPLSSRSDMDLESSMERTMCRLCVIAAIRLITLIHDNKDSTNLPNMWYNIFYVYTSAIVLLAAQLQPSLDGELDSNLMDAAWKNTLSLLRQFEIHSVSASRCLRILEVIHDKISSATNHTVTKPVFDFLPRTVDAATEIGSSADLLNVMYDQVSPFSDQTIEFSLSEMFRF